VVSKNPVGKLASIASPDGLEDDRRGARVATHDPPSIEVILSVGDDELEDVLFP